MRRRQYIVTAYVGRQNIVTAYVGRQYIKFDFRELFLAALFLK